MRSLIPLAKEILRLPVTIGVPSESDRVSGAVVSDPVYAAVVGTVTLARRYQGARRSVAIAFSVSGFWQSVKNLFGKILP